MSKYTIKFSKQELDRVWYVFNEELKSHKENIQDGYIGYEGCLEDARLVINKLKPLYKEVKWNLIR